MDTLVVKKVEHFGDSAEVTLASGKGELVAFCYPCELTEGQVVPNILHGMAEEARAAYLSDWPEDVKAARATERLERTGPFGYRGCGMVIDQSAGLIEVFGFVLDLGDLPCTGPVEFERSRIDI
ncbi:hypothetical protein [Stenotrophomonas sp. UBA7606]|uniref:hypothetical protein n=1 Tax=Stenotrophomonas sp. UBA7606 TaxID=1947559 RepID=UPI0025E72AD0|nr:hypothetical protein [Stenotrophomonas sp. UBA7606]